MHSSECCHCVYEQFCHCSTESFRKCNKAWILSVMTFMFKPLNVQWWFEKSVMDFMSKSMSWSLKFLERVPWNLCHYKHVMVTFFWWWGVSWIFCRNIHDIVIDFLERMLLILCYNIHDIVTDIFAYLLVRVSWILCRDNYVIVTDILEVRKDHVTVTWVL